MEEHINRLLFGDLPIGDLIVSLILYVIVLLLICSFAFGILWFIFISILRVLKWTKKKDGIPNFRYELKIDELEERVGSTIRFPFTLIFSIFQVSSLHNRSKYLYHKSLIIGISIFVITVFIWLTSSYSPIKDYMLMSKSVTTNGYITMAEELTEVVETNEGRTSRLKYLYFFRYEFQLPNGKLIKTYGTEQGYIPDYLVGLQKPFEVEVEYLSKYPNASRIKGMDSNITSTSQWIRQKIVFQVFLFLMLGYILYKYIKFYFEKYKNEKEKGNLQNVS